MTQPHEKRIKRLSQHCERDSDAEQCDGPYADRLSVLEFFRQSQTGFDVFTAPIRLKVAFLLFKLKSACVCEIQYALDESRQTLVSHHIREMKKEGWLKSKRKGKWAYYSLTEKKRNQLRTMLNNVLGD
jgi:ArsR family transcriptional regulator